MVIDLAGFLGTLSRALDYVENEVVKINKGHGKRVAILVNRMAKASRMDDDSVFAIMQAAVLHDCALMDYLSDEKKWGSSLNEKYMASHCISGEQFVRVLPFYKLAEDAILYHHEEADGNGAFGLRGDEVPLGAQFVHMADVIDVKFGLNEVDQKKFEEIQNWMDQQKGHLFTAACIDIWKQSIDFDYLEKCSHGKYKQTFSEINPEKMIDIPIDLFRKMTALFAEITDYKSPFTKRHSMGIAEKAETMGHYYGLDEETCSCLYMAGALHDIGKLMISDQILEKPGKLSDEEYEKIQNHAMGTYKMLSNIKGLEEITRWAALHHEKLDGSGYPFGLKGEDLGKMERLLACLDIYQALREDRPYKAGFSHEKTMGILMEMGKKNKLDADIVKDIDACMGAL